MNLKHSFDITADQETAWAVLLDIPRIARCMPGTELTEAVDERTYKGHAAVKVGPVALQFAGEARIVEIDDAGHRAVVHAKGADRKGRGSANATLRFNLAPRDERTTRVDVETDLNLTGAVAQYGRASGLIDAVAEQIIAEFVRNLEGDLAKSSPTDSAAAQTSPPGGAAAAPASEQDAPGVASTSPQAKAPVSGLTLLFKAIAAMVRGWLRKRRDTSMTGNSR